MSTYLLSLAGTGEKGRQREVIANVFGGVQSRMVSGCLLRDSINKVGGIHFSASEDIHTLSHLYESMLHEMRDAAGDSGEFYTPRPVVRFMVEGTVPKLRQTNGGNCAALPPVHHEEAEAAWGNAPLTGQKYRRCEIIV